MYDRPNAGELLEAAWHHLETLVIPVLKHDRKLYFQTLVAINVLKVVAREQRYRPDHLKAQWNRLNAVQDVDLPLPSNWEESLAALAIRNRELCYDIRAGRYDSDFLRETLYQHLYATTLEQLQVAKPRYLEQLAAEGPVS
ncbi:MAG: DUF6285 domain-containing protein [Aggregatilineales bacterium]